MSLLTGELVLSASRVVLTLHSTPAGLPAGEADPSAYAVRYQALTGNLRPCRQAGRGRGSRQVVVEAEELWLLPHEVAGGQK